ncbi:uncharacterized protein JCM15063_001110 [Sporobolomyces koalae]|uniref:uncharacterized protein n=1 Tax=Sporobolomyces koalae TaxID=500713 RepID=UPI003173FC5A
MERKHVCILPDSVPLVQAAESPSTASRFLRLPHPRTHQPVLFLPYTRDAGASTSDGILEVQKLALDADKQRSWFLEQEVVSDGNLSIFAPFDPVFLIVSYLSTLPPHFVSYADLWETVSQQQFAPSTSTDIKQDEEDPTPFADDLLRLSRLECVKSRFEKVCETQVYDSTTLYRLSPTLVLDLLQSKVAALADSIDGIFGAHESTEPGETREAVDVVKPFPTVSRGVGREGIGSGQGLSTEIQTESRQKYAIGVLSNYLAPKSTEALLAAYEFPNLVAYTSSHSTSAFLGTTYLPGRKNSDLDIEASASKLGGGNAAAIAKKRKLESKGSRGVEALKKVNTRGMKSLAEMFGKQTTTTTKPKSSSTTAANKKKKV